MSFHPDRVTIHAEHHRQELMAQAHRYRLAKDITSNGAFPVRAKWTGVAEAVAARVRSLAGRWRQRLSGPIEFPVARDLQR
jgi:hypothetical protein